MCFRLVYDHESSCVLCPRLWLDLILKALPRTAVAREAVGHGNIVPTGINELLLRVHLVLSCKYLTTIFPNPRSGAAGLSQKKWAVK